MKEMEYQPEFIQSGETLHEGEYMGYEFVIISYGHHPCAYVGVPKGSKFFKKWWGRNCMSNIDGKTHGGLTYSRMGVNGRMMKKWVLGWDYAHAGDFSGSLARFAKYGIEGRKWSTEEIYEHVKAVIEEIIKEEKDDNRKRHS